MPTQESVRPVTNSKFSSLDKIAILLLSLPQNEVEKIFSRFNVHEIRTIVERMTAIGSVKKVQIEDLCLEFLEAVEKMINKSDLSKKAERVLGKFSQPFNSSQNLTESQETKLNGLSETLKNITSSSLAHFLKNEHPQIISLILSRLQPQKAASVLTEFPESLTIDVINRMLSMGEVPQEIVNEVENTLKAEFKDMLIPAVQQDAWAHMADIFNAFDPKVEVKFMQELESKNSEAAQHIKELILTIEDLKYVEGTGIKTILDIVDKDKLVIALKGASESLKEIFFSNMSERSAKLLKEEITALGMVKIRTVYEAQQEIVNQAKEFIRKGEIHLNKLIFNKRV